MSKTPTAGERARKYWLAKWTRSNSKFQMTNEEAERLFDELESGAPENGWWGAVEEMREAKIPGLKGNRAQWAKMHPLDRLVHFQFSCPFINREDINERCGGDPLMTDKEGEPNAPANEFCTYIVKLAQSQGIADATFEKAMRALRNYRRRHNPTPQWPKPKMDYDGHYVMKPNTGHNSQGVECIPTEPPRPNPMAEAARIREDQSRRRRQAYLCKDGFTANTGLPPIPKP